MRSLHLHILIAEDTGIRIKVWSPYPTVDWGAILEMCNSEDTKITFPNA